MPLFHWKKTRRYEVSSRNSYVVCINLLDAKLLECTLTADSCGYECLENISQRIELNQLEYFGLRYVNKKLQFHWVELDKPLKKQLDKNAHSPLLYFGVMFYVPDPQKILDDMTRYQYYLQLKNDVIDGRLACSPEKAVLLAAYSVQAELGDFDYERHTVENLKDIVLLPRNMTVDERSLLELTQDIINNHQTLVGWSAATAEVEYMLEAQQLDGYGMDCYSAKDSSSQDVLLGAFYQGIFVKNLASRHHGKEDHFEWSEVTYLGSSKKHFTISVLHKEKPIHFTLDDHETAKYIQKNFTLQMKFFMERGQNTKETDYSVGSRTPDSQVEGFTSQSSAAVDSPTVSASRASPGSIQLTQNDSLHLTEDTNLTIINPNSTLAKTSEAMYYSTGNIFTTGQEETVQHHQQQQQQQQAVHHASPSPLTGQRMGETPQPQLTSTTGTPASVPYTSNSYLNTTPGPPSYRHAPDYETVIQQRVASTQHRQLQQPAYPQSGMDPQMAYLSNIVNTQLYAHPGTLTYSQPEINQLSHVPGSAMYHVTDGVHSGLANGSVFHHPMESSVGVPLHQSHHSPMRPVDRTSSLIIYPTYVSPESKPVSPERNPKLSTSEHMLSELVYQYKSPPPYPRPSNSTPDLATQNRGANMSPDLIPSHHLYNEGLKVQSFLDKSMENLALDSYKQSFRQQARLAPSKISHDDNSSMHSDMLSRQLVQPTSSIPDVALNSLMTHDYQEVGAPYITNPLQCQTDADMAFSTGGSSHSLKLPASLAMTDTYIQTPAYPYTDAISFDNPAFTENVPYYLAAEMAAQSSNSASEYIPQLANPSSQIASASELPADVQMMPPTAQESDNSALTVAAQERRGVVLRRKKKNSESACKDSLVGATQEECEEDKEIKRLSMGALKMAAMNGLTLTSERVIDDATSDSVESGEEFVSRKEDTPTGSKDERRKQLEAKLEAGQVFVEFEKVHKKNLRCECSVANQPANKDRNRFKDVFPYDVNRVKLTPTKENPMGYINASNIKVRVGQEELWYLAAQGPLPNTVNDFWQMIWEQEIQVVAMLTKLHEHGREKCQRYWPELVGPKHRVQHAQYQVTMKFSNDAGPYTTSGLMVKHLPSNRERFVWHLQYTDWPDHGCPDDVQGFLAYLDEIEAVKRQTQQDKKESHKAPVLTHCSAGVGRTGVVILTEAIKTCLEHNEEVDVPGTLAILRDQRMYTVQTVSQYGFVYKTLIEYLKGSRLI